ncbi:MAG: archaeosortase/exosortase family protein [Alkalinema sp. RU_4_3]|nr:archaeosortase/exosortase family protein [Alkalinema sp. RU_4_3]
MSRTQFRLSISKLSIDYYLLATSGLGLIYLHLLLTWKLINNPDQLLLNVIFWGTIVHLIWLRRFSLRIQSDWFSCAIGSLLMGLLLHKSMVLAASESEFIRIFPGFAGLALALVASGWKLSLYRREFALMLVLMLPPGLLGRLLEWSIGPYIERIIAQSAAFAMHYCGVNLISQGANIIFKTGVIRVEYACTGIPIWILLFQLSILIAMGFRLPWVEMVKLLGISTGITWFLATMRVMVMSAAMNHQSSFDYWHGTAGGQFFSTTAIILFALFCRHLPSIAKSFS